MFAKNLNKTLKTDIVKPKPKFVGQIFEKDERENQQSESLTQTQNQEYSDSWTKFLSGETVTVSELKQIQKDIQSEVEEEQKKIEKLETEAFLAPSSIVKEHHKVTEIFPARGSLNFTESLKSIEITNNLETTSYTEIKHFENINNPEKPKANSTKDIDVEEFEEFDVSLKEPQSEKLIDFPLFFGFLGKTAAGTAENVHKHFLNAKNFIFAKSTLIDDLLFTKILGFGEKKKSNDPKAKEAEAIQMKQNANKRAFFDNLKAAARSIFLLDFRRGMKGKIAEVNKAVGNSNLSYEGIIDEKTGNIKESILEEAEKKNAEKSQAQLRKEKLVRMQASRGKAKKGPGVTMSADKAHNFNNAAKLAG